LLGLFESFKGLLWELILGEGLRMEQLCLRKEIEAPIRWKTYCWTGNPELSWQKNVLSMSQSMTRYAEIWGVYALSKVHPVPYRALERGAKQASVVSDVTDGHS
jgi:hypothetical protein